MYLFASLRAEVLEPYDRPCNAPLTESADNVVQHSQLIPAGDSDSSSEARGVKLREYDGGCRSGAAPMQICTARSYLAQVSPVALVGAASALLQSGFWYRQPQRTADLQLTGGQSASTTRATHNQSTGYATLLMRL